MNQQELSNIFRRVIKYPNTFTPYIIEYIEFNNHIAELSTNRDSFVTIDGFGFNGKYGVTIITNNNGEWEHDSDLSLLCNDYKEAIEYIESLKLKEE